MKLLQSIEAERKHLQTIEEAAGMLKRAMGKAAGMVGMKGKAANLKAQGDSAQKIQQLKIAFQQFAGQMGKTLKNASVNDLQSFFKSKNLPFAAQNIKAKKGDLLSSIPSKALTTLFQTAIQGGAKREMRQQSAQPQQAQQQAQQQKAGGKAPQQKGNAPAGKLQQVISSLSPAQSNSLIAALQGAT